MSKLGVGIIGAGLVTQAIHLPALAALTDQFRVVHVMDVDEQTGSQVARQAGARFSTRTESLLADDEVDVVAVCSPHQFHADQLISACAAGKRGILCEKPLATTASQAADIARAADSSGIPILVGAMHAYDPAMICAMEASQRLAGAAHLVRSTIYLPPNREMIDHATTPLLPPAPPSPPPAASERERVESMIRGAVLGLVSHHAPLVRAYAPAATAVRYARAAQPWGYDIVLTGGGATIQLTSVMGGQWAPDWRLEAWGADADLHVSFPPSYVLSGSARATYRDPSGTRSWAGPRDGYQNEWIHLADVIAGRCALRYDLASAIADLKFALRLAEAAAPMAAEGLSEATITTGEGSA